MRQQSLFTIRETPEGLVFKPDFLTVQEERELLDLLQTLPFYEFFMASQPNDACCTSVCGTRSRVAC
jgi:hypothetical protein